MVPPPTPIPIPSVNVKVPFRGKNIAKTSVNYFLWCSWIFVLKMVLKWLCLYILYIFMIIKTQIRHWDINYCKRASFVTRRSVYRFECSSATYTPNFPNFHMASDTELYELVIGCFAWKLRLADISDRSKFRKQLLEPIYEKTSAILCTTQN